MRFNVDVVVYNLADVDFARFGFHAERYQRLVVLTFRG